ncbi:MAG: cysteine desulfurase family protein [bacterium]
MANRETQGAFMQVRIKKPVYLDYNATTPHAPEVIAVMRPYLDEHFGNPSSSHWYGIQTKNAVERARSQVASLLQCQPKEIVFTSGGTESNNYALKGTAFALYDKGNHIITTQIEHPAVIEVCKFLEKHNFKVTYLPVNEYGLLNISDVEKAITPQTILITTMHANNEVGTIQPIEQISQIAEKQRIIMHTDAAQSVGKIPINVDVMGIDLLSIAGHKLYAPKGIGALYIRKGTGLAKFIQGAGQEQERRAGTENILGIVGLGKACEVVECEMEKNISHMKMMRDTLHNGLIKKLHKELGDRSEEVKLNGHPEKRLPNTLNVSFKNIEANNLLSEIKDNVAASAGAACHSGGIEVSSVLKAMNVPEEWARGTVRFSTGRMTTKKEIEKAINIISDTVLRIRRKRNGKSTKIA